MGILAIVSTVVYIALTVFFVLLWVRLIFDLVASYSRDFRPAGPLLVIAEVTYTITDPPIRFVRRIVPPLRVGGIQLDFALSIVMLAVFILLPVVSLGFVN